MKTVKLGRSSLSGSELCLGTMYFGIKVSEEESFALMDYYYERGGRFYDTANKYATWVPGFPEPVGEHVLGRWIRSRACRDDIVVATKMGFPYGDVPRGLRKELIQSEVEKSLKRLGLDKIDLLYAHCDDYDTPQEEYMEAFNSLVESGKVGALGASNFYAWRLARANQLALSSGWTPFCCVQSRQSVLWPKVNGEFGRQLPASVEILDYCRREDVAMLCYSPLLQGFFGRDDRGIPPEYDTVENNEIVRLFREDAAAQGVSANTLVLSWMSSEGFIPLITGSSAAQLKENIDALEYSVNPDIADRIRKLYYPHQD